jgi:hypothetical protein
MFVRRGIGVVSVVLVTPPRWRSRCVEQRTAPKQELLSGAAMAVTVLHVLGDPVDNIGENYTCVIHE